MFEEASSPLNDPICSHLSIEQIISTNRQRRAHCASLELELTQLAGHINAINYQFIKLLAEFDEHGGWQVDGVKTFAHWLNWKCGIGALAAREKIRVARALNDLPLINESFRSGEIRHSRQPEDATANKIVSAETKPENVPAETIRENVSAETFVENDAEESWSEPVNDFPANRATALVRIAEQFLTHNPADETNPPSGPDRYHVVVHVNTNEQHRDFAIEGSASCYLGHNRFLAPQVAKRLACDASVSTVLEDDEGNVLNIGRRSRTISHAMRTALTIRDGGCRFPNCYSQHWTDAHHIKHWSDGGETNLDNLITLCRHHHTLVHRGDYQIEDNGTEVVFYDKRKSLIPRAFFPQFPESQDPPKVIGRIMLSHAAKGLHIEPDTAVTKWRGESIDYAHAIYGLFRLDKSPDQSGTLIEDGN